MSCVGQEDVQQVCCFDTQAAVIFAGVTAEPFRFVYVLVHQQLDLMLTVVHETQYAGGTGGAADESFHILRRGKGQSGGADLMAQILGDKGLVLGHGQQIKGGLLTIAQHKIFADADAQYIGDDGAVFHGVGNVMRHTGIGDVQLLQQGEGCLLLSAAVVGRGRGVNIGNPHSVGLFSCF